MRLHAPLGQGLRFLGFGWVVAGYWLALEVEFESLVQTHASAVYHRMLRYMGLRLIDSRVRMVDLGY